VYWLSRIISAESKGEPLRGQLAVGNVVLNRVRHRSYPNTIYGVIFERWQFTPAMNGTIYESPSWLSTIAAKMCLEGYSISNEILFFCNPRTSESSWVVNNRPYAFTLGRHAFYF
jgi:N-acetylmuramoyl-L-alanine amidase